MQATQQNIDEANLELQRLNNYKYSTEAPEALKLLKRFKPTYEQENKPNK